MDSSGNMVSFEELKKKPLKEQEAFKEVPENLVSMLEGMNRHERRKWFALNKKHLKKVTVDVKSPKQTKETTS